MDGDFPWSKDQTTWLLRCSHNAGSIQIKRMHADASPVTECHYLDHVSGYWDILMEDVKGTLSAQKLYHSFAPAKEPIKKII